MGDKVIYVAGCGIGPAGPAAQKLVGKLHERCEKILRNTNPDAVRSAIMREMRMVRAIMMEEHGVAVDDVHVTLTDGHSSERIDLT